MFCGMFLHRDVVAMFCFFDILNAVSIINEIPVEEEISETNISTISMERYHLYH